MFKHNVNYSIWCHVRWFVHILQRFPQQLHPVHYFKTLGLYVRRGGQFMIWGSDMKNNCVGSAGSLCLLAWSPKYHATLS